MMLPAEGPGILKHHRLSVQKLPEFFSFRKHLFGIGISVLCLRCRRLDQDPVENTQPLLLFLLVNVLFTMDITHRAVSFDLG